jgi:glycosyltransferase involved in cell wall biosynthesis
MLNPNLIMVGSKIGSFGVQSSKMYADMFKTDVSILTTDWWAFPDFPKLHPTAILHSPQDSEEYDPGTYEMTKLYFSVTTFTEWAKRDFEKHGIKVDAIIPHGCDTSIFRPLDKKECRRHFGFPEDKFIFGMVSANNDKEDRKNWSGTLRAFRHLLDQDPDIGRDCRLVLFTDPNNAAGYPITAIVNKLKLQEYVYLFPSHIFNVGISEHELNILYNCFDVHVLCSKREGFGLTILESMCAGIPNIVHNYSAMPELVEGRGWLVKSLTSGVNRVITPINSEFNIPDTYDLYEKMKRAYQRTEEREKYSVLARKFALQYDWNLIFKEKWIPYLRQIEEKLKKHPSSVIGVSEKKDELFKSKYQEVV